MDYVRRVFDQDDALSMLRPVQAIVTHLEKFPRERAVAACPRADYYGAYRYDTVKRILVQGLDLQPPPITTVRRLASTARAGTPAVARAQPPWLLHDV